MTRLWVGHLLEELIEKHFKEKLSRLMGLSNSAAATSKAESAAASSSIVDHELLTGLRGLIFGDFMQPGAGGSCVGGVLPAGDSFAAHCLTGGCCWWC